MGTLPEPTWGTTQDVSCELGAIHRYGYAGTPHVAHETMLLWYLDL